MAENSRMLEEDSNPNIDSEDSDRKQDDSHHNIVYESSNAGYNQEDSNPNIVYESSESDYNQESSPQAYPPPLKKYPLPAQQVPLSIAPIIYLNPAFGTTPSLRTCRDCKTIVTTRIYTTHGTMVWMMFLLFYLILPCLSCLPFFNKSWYDYSHYCPLCSRLLGMYRPFD